MKKLTCLMTYFLTLVTTAALALDLTPYETRARKDTVANSAQIVTDVDMAGVGNAVQVELDGKTAPAGVSNIVTAAMSNRTVTVNGQSGALNSNLVFTVQAGGAFTNTLADAAANGGFAGTEDLRPGAIYFDEIDLPWYSLIGPRGLAAGNFTQRLRTDLVSEGIESYTYDTDNVIETRSVWSFARSTGNYTVAATSDLDAKLDATGGTANNLSLTGTLALTNATSFFAGVYQGTNGVAFTRSGTNYWILLP